MQLYPGWSARDNYGIKKKRPTIVVNNPTQKKFIRELHQSPQKPPMKNSTPLENGKSSIPTLDVPSFKAFQIVRRRRNVERGTDWKVSISGANIADERRNVRVFSRMNKAIPIPARRSTRAIRRPSVPPRNRTTTTRSMISIVMTFSLDRSIRSTTSTTRATKRINRRAKQCILSHPNSILRSSFLASLTETFALRCTFFIQCLFSSL